MTAIRFPNEAGVAHRPGCRRPDRLQLWTPPGWATSSSRPNSADFGIHTRPFTDIPTMSGEDDLVIARNELVYAILNLYPATPAI